MILPAPAPADARPPVPPPPLRERARRAVCAEVRDTAVELFLRQGFEKTTADQLCAVVGLSRSTFFRYFATKEDVLLFGVEEQGRRLRDALAARPEQEPVWASLRAALDPLVRASEHDTERTLALCSMVAETPSLRSRQHERRASWTGQLVPEVARRLELGQDDPRPAALVGALLACLDVAVEAWRVQSGASSLATVLDLTTAALADPGDRARAARDGRGAA